MEKWWESLELINGVFKGGGARGVAYAGALEAVRDDGRWFGAVAGASAGAITAALVAAGFTPGELSEATAKALDGVKPRLLHMLVAGTTIYDPRQLARWLDDQLRVRVRGASVGEAVSFAELVHASGIELYVVAMDLHSGAPVVFSAGLTPDVSVSAAVLASSAIPGALPSGRAVVGEGGSLFINQLVDGGAYANFPQFVFTSPSFRAWYEAQVANGMAGPASRDTLGFVLDDELVTRQAPIIQVVSPQKERVEDRYDRGTSATSGHPGQYLLSDVIGGHPGRVAIAATVLILLTAILWAGPNAIRVISIWAWEQLGRWWPIVSLAATFTIIAAVTVITLVGAAVVMFGRVASTTIVPAVRAAMGTATGVPPWVGSRHTRPEPISRDFRVLMVPAKGAKTLSFRLSDKMREQVVRTAHDHVRLQLLDSIRSAADTTATEADAEAEAKAAAQHPRTADFLRSLTLALVAVLALAGSAGLLVSAELASAPARIGSSAGALGLGVVALAVLWRLLRRGATRARLRAAAPWNESAEHRGTERERYAKKGIYGLLLVAGGFALMPMTVGTASRDRFEAARITASVAQSGDTRYDIVIKSDGRRIPAEFVSSGSFRPNQRVLVTRGPDERRELARALPLGRPFLVQLILAALGFLAAAAGIALWVSAQKDFGASRHRRFAHAEAGSAGDETTPRATAEEPAQAY